MYDVKSGPLCPKQVSRAGASDYIPQYGALDTCFWHNTPEKYYIFRNLHGDYFEKQNKTNKTKLK